MWVIPLSSHSLSVHLIFKIFKHLRMWINHTFKVHLWEEDKFLVSIINTFQVSMQVMIGIRVSYHNHLTLDKVKIKRGKHLSKQQLNNSTSHSKTCYPQMEHLKFRISCSYSRLLDLHTLNLVCTKIKKVLKYLENSQRNNTRQAGSFLKLQRVILKCQNIKMLRSSTRKYSKLSLTD
jgi:hypothetical protein